MKTRGPLFCGNDSPSTCPNGRNSASGTTLYVYMRPIYLRPSQRSSQTSEKQTSEKHRRHSKSGGPPVRLHDSTTTVLLFCLGLGSAEHAPLFGYRVDPKEKGNWSGGQLALVASRSQDLWQVVDNGALKTTGYIKWIAFLIHSKIMLPVLHSMLRLCPHHTELPYSRKILIFFHRNNLPYGSRVSSVHMKVTLPTLLRLYLGCE